MKRIILSFFLFSTLFSFPVGAEDVKPLIRLLPLTIDGLGPEEAQFLLTLIQSYVTDIGELDIPLAESSPAFPDFILSGSITADQDGRVLSIEVVKSETGERVYHTSTHKTTSDLTLKVRSLVEAAFSSGFTGVSAPGETHRELLTDGKILGTWRGDAGIEIVRIQGGGTAMAILSSGAQMYFVYTIENNTLKLTQTSPNRTRFYHPMPFEVARELITRAEPWRYELFLSDNGAVLRGIKISTGVSYGDGGTVEFIPGSIREAEWTKSVR